MISKHGHKSSRLNHYLDIELFILSQYESKKQINSVSCWEMYQRRPLLTCTIISLLSQPTRQRVESFISVYQRAATQPLSVETPSVATKALQNDWKLISKTTSPCFPRFSGLDCKIYRPLIIIFSVIFYCDSVLICLWLKHGTCYTHHHSQSPVHPGWDHSNLHHLHWPHPPPLDHPQQAGVAGDITEIVVTIPARLHLINWTWCFWPRKPC